MDTQTAISAYQKEKNEAFTVNVVQRLTDFCLQKFGDAVPVPHLRSITVGRDVMSQLLQTTGLTNDPEYCKEHGDQFMGLSLKESRNLPAGAYVMHDGKGNIIAMGNIYDAST